MIRTAIPMFCLCFSTVISVCQSGRQVPEFNFGFEKNTFNENIPDGWFIWGTGYDLKVDTSEKKSGKASMLIQPAGEITEYNVGSVGYAIPANLEGKVFTVSAYMKLVNVTGGPAFLAITAADAAGMTIASASNYPDSLLGTSDWSLYTITMDRPENATAFYIAAALTGKGQLWVDDFQVFLDGKEIQKAKLIKPVAHKADKDIAFDTGSGISRIDMTETMTEDLMVLGKVWGFLKYYHPGIASGEYNWDYELFRILPDVLATKGQEERNEVLEEWVDRLGKIKARDVRKEDKGDIKLRPDLDWINHPELGARLNGRLAGIKTVVRDDEHYYIGLAPVVGNPVFKNERSYATMKYPDAGFRLLCLYRYWNIIAYYFPYRHLIEEDWDGVLKEFIPKFVNASNELEYKLAVLALIARVHDTHANIWGQDSIIRDFRGIRYAPVEVEFIEHKAVVTGYMDDALGEASGLMAGDIVEAINGRPVDEIVSMKLPVTPASNYPTQLRDIARHLLRTNDSIMELDCRRVDSAFTRQVNCVTYKKLNLSNSYLRNDTCYKMISPDIAWLYPGTIKNAYLPVIMPEIMKTKGLIIDFRCYPSDFIVFSLSEYLHPEPTNFVKFSVGSITSPGLFVMAEPLKAGKATDDFYKGKIVIIVNELTQSSAEYHTMAFRTAPGALVIGSTTAGADGNVSQFYLPGGISTMISGIGVYYPDGTETQRIGIVPDIEVKPTIKGIQTGRDEVLEKAIEIINTQ